MSDFLLAGAFFSCGRYYAEIERFPQVALMGRRRYDSRK
jgi:hypothetical protein